MSYTVSFYTLGCRVNQYESDAIAEALENTGFVVVPFGTRSDVAVVNTCTVTSESDRKSRQAVRKAARNFPDTKIVVVGCSSQISPELFTPKENIYHISGNTEKDKIAYFIKNLLEDNAVKPENADCTRDISSAEYDDLTITHARRARAYVKIEDGCENRCAYCIIPKARGPVRSKAKETVISEVKEIAKSCPEIILTGIETASYGRDRKEKGALEELLIKVSEIDGITRLTVGSLDPNILTEHFLETVSKIPSFLPHLHISMQSGCTTVLNRMRRKYNAEKALERIQRTREYIPDMTFSADVIVGFPGETDEEFEKTVEFFKAVRFMHLHIFPYSIRPDTEAAEMKNQVPENVKHERCRRLAEVQAQIKKEILKSYVEAYKDGGAGVLFEQQQKDVNIGHSRHYIEVRVACEKDLSNTVVDVRLTHTDGEICYGEIK